MTFSDLDNVTQIAINEEARNLCITISQECFLGQSGETGAANFAHYHPFEFRAIVKEVFAGADSLVLEKLCKKYDEHIKALSGTTPTTEGENPRELEWLLKKTAVDCEIRKILREEEFHHERNQSSVVENKLREKFDCNPGKCDTLGRQLRKEIVERAIKHIEQLQHESVDGVSASGIWTARTTAEPQTASIKFP